MAQTIKMSACSAGDLGSTPGSGRSPGEGNGNLLQYSCLENPMDRGACWVILSTGSQGETEQLSVFYREVHPREERMRPRVFSDYLHANFLGRDGILSTLPWTYILYQILEAYDYLLITK